MKASLHLKLSQHLALTPQLQQSIKLLQLSTVELNQELEKFLLENPLLEREDNESRETDSAASDAAGDRLAEAASVGAYSDSDYAPGQVSATQVANETSEKRELEFDSSEFSTAGGFESMGGSGQANSDDDDGDRIDREEYGAVSAASISLQKHLLAQLGLMPLSLRDRQMAAFIIAHLDDDGYLSFELDDLVQMLAASGDEMLAEIGDEDVEEMLLSELTVALSHVQHLEPVGVGARSLAECLRLQLDQLPLTTPHLADAKALVMEHLTVLGQRDFAKLKRLLRLSDDELRATRALIVALDPKPGRGFGQGDTRFVVPDVVVKKVRGKWRAMLNQAAMPKLRVNQFYADLLHKSRDAKGKNLAGQLQEARWLIKNIQQRFETILKVTEAIVENQRHFFDHGEVAMRPLVLREIADQVGLHESTVSRVTTQKYMLTPRGIYELKYFFGSSVATEAGGACSATAIRALIKQLVEAEDQRKPLSDNKIADLLSNQGILVARRTIAKYRESLQIQPASLRKSI
ncbi:MAG: RNA polymerase factor sigma-54 [Burkholderiales bacterium]|jgi:RNA polymerase sigma-54 factor|nr:RNA polymerase factor sigma-54 [Betaproteobacteria bacterium]